MVVVQAVDGMEYSLSWWNTNLKTNVSGPAWERLAEVPFGARLPAFCLAPLLPDALHHVNTVL
jgi:hypothetical protein